jgi:hypothetical protein
MTCQIPTLQQNFSQNYWVTLVTELQFSHSAVKACQISDFIDWYIIRFRCSFVCLFIYISQQINLRSDRGIFSTEMASETSFAFDTFHSMARAVFQACPSPIDSCMRQVSIKKSNDRTFQITNDASSQTSCLPFSKPNVRGIPKRTIGAYDTTEYSGLYSERELLYPVQNSITWHSTSVTDIGKWAKQDTFKTHILRLGGFHTMSCFVASIGKLWGDGGLKDLLIESSVYAAKENSYIQSKMV